MLISFALGVLTNTPKPTHLSLPEEINQAKPGDKMGWRVSHDTIYLEFNPTKNPLTITK